MSLSPGTEKVPLAQEIYFSFYGGKGGLGFFGVVVSQVILIQNNQYVKVSHFGVTCHSPLQWE